MGKAIRSRDASFICRLAHEQKDAGADMLDVHAGVIGESEADALAWLVQVIQAEIDIPLMLDSLDSQAIEAALKIHRGRAIINSLSGEQGRWQELLSLAVKYHCGAVVLCINDAGIPATAQGRLAVAKELVSRTLDVGMEPQDLYLDPLVLSVGADYQAGKVTLETLRLIHQNFPKVHTICAISNVSFGLPRRRLLNANFLAMAVTMGLDTFLGDMRDKAMTATIWTANAIAGKDDNCTKYLKAYRAGKLQL